MILNTRNSNKVDIAIIGGTGIYDNNIFREEKVIKPSTPYGPTSEQIIIGSIGDKKIAFLSRHGKGHRIPPHMINFRANIWALKELGVTRIIAPSAVGSLNYDFKPGDIVLPDQFIDFTKNRNYSFFDGSTVCHVSMADPFCSDLRNNSIESLKTMDFSYHEKGTYVCIEGPRFSTRSESKMFRDVFKADIIGMTLVPECILAREAEICYLSISTVTDYDVWAEHPVTTKEILETLGKNVIVTKNLISKLLPLISTDRNYCSCGKALDDALL